MMNKESTKKTKLPSEIKRAEYLYKQKNKEAERKKNEMLELYKQFNLNPDEYFNVNHLPITVSPVLTNNFTARQNEEYMNNIRENNGELTLPIITSTFNPIALKIKTKEEINKENNDWELIVDMLYSRPDLNITKILEELKISRSYYDYLNKLKIKNGMNITEFRKQSEIYQGNYKAMKEKVNESKSNEYKELYDKFTKYVLEFPDKSLMTVLKELNISRLTYKRMIEVYPRISEIRKTNIGKVRIMPELTKKALVEGKQKFIESKKEKQKETDSCIYIRMNEIVNRNPKISLQELLNELQINQSTYVRMTKDKAKLQELKNQVIKCNNIPLENEDEETIEDVENEDDYQTSEEDYEEQIQELRNDLNEEEMILRNPIAKLDEDFNI